MSLSTYCKKHVALAFAIFPTNAFGRYMWWKTHTTSWILWTWRWSTGENLCMSGSCHILSVEIVIELGIFVFFWCSTEKCCKWILLLGTPSCYSKLNKSDLYQFQSDFIQMKVKKKTKIPSSTTISTLRIWHEPDIDSNLNYILTNWQAN